MKWEISDSRLQLEGRLGRPVTSFSYPHGDFDSSVRLLVEEAGYECACTTSETAVTKRVDLFGIPRIAVESCSGDELAARLEQLLL